MFINRLIISLFIVVFSVGAQAIRNPGFESGWSSWTDIDPDKNATAISGFPNEGAKSAKITRSNGRFEQKVRLFADSDYELKAFVRGPGKIGIDLGGETLIADSKGDGKKWVPISIPFKSGAHVEAVIFGAFNGGEGRFDDFVLIGKTGAALADEIERAKGPKVYAKLEGSCTNLKQLKFYDVEDDGSSEDIHPPKLAMDGSFDPESRWSSKGAGKTLEFTFGVFPQTVKEVGIAFYKGNERTSSFEITSSIDRKRWRRLREAESAGQTTAIEKFDLDDHVARYIRVTGFGNSSNEWNSIVEVQAYGCGQAEMESTNDGSAKAQVKGVSIHGLKMGQTPAENFDLKRWKITLPIDADGDKKADEIDDKKLAAGWNDDRFFYTDPATGGMVFRTATFSAATTPNTKYVRSELREMLRGGDLSIATRPPGDVPNRNNWVFSSAPKSAQMLAGGVDGVLKAKLAINQVSRLGDSSQVGRVIIGQIHAKDDEPIRLYYRKLPNNKFGSIYFAHEAVDKPDTWVEMIGSRSDRAENPADGIALDEVFSYEIKVEGREINGVIHPFLLVKIIRDDGSAIESKPLDMIDSGFNIASEFMYFKAGAYTQNSGNKWPGRDFDQVTFFELEASHNPVPK